MTNMEEKEPELFVRQLIRQVMNDQLKEQQGNNSESNNSVIFLEKSTLNMLMIYLLLNGERQVFRDLTKEHHKLPHAQTLEMLEQVMLEQKQEFETLITFIQEKL